MAPPAFTPSLFSLRFSPRSLRLCVEYAFLFGPGTADKGNGRREIPVYHR
jgi:hypothetical protein